ncbi:MAG: hypothetical protein WC006_04605 [Bacilli bacterium]|nr:hypothetical protein [Bacilli bacterium]
MHIDLILLTNEVVTNPLLKKFEFKQLPTNQVLKDTNNLENGISFDYIIVENQDSLKNLDILKDEDAIICNFFFQTNFENIFFIGKENKSKKSISEQISIILEYLS